MAHFETDAEVYDQLGGILANLVGNTDRLEQLRQADAIVQFSFRAPDAKVTLDVRAGRRPRVELGDTRVRPDVVFAMDADTGYALLHGELSATVAFAQGAVRLKGPVGKALRVVPATVGAHEVEPDEPVEPVVAGAEAPADEAAGAPEGGAAPADEGAGAPEGGAAPAAEPAAPEAAAVPAAEPEAPVSGDATAVEGEPAADGAGEAAPAEPEAVSAAEAADAAGGEQPPAAPDEQG